MAKSLHTKYCTSMAELNYGEGPEGTFCKCCKGRLSRRSCGLARSTFLWNLENFGLDKFDIYSNKISWKKIKVSFDLSQYHKFSLFFDFLKRFLYKEVYTLFRKIGLSLLSFYPVYAQVRRYSANGGANQANKKNSWNWSESDGFNNQ